MSARRDGAVVELLGAPGAGKSGLADALAALDGVTVVKDHSRGDLSALAWSKPRWPRNWRATRASGVPSCSA